MLYQILKGMIMQGNFDAEQLLCRLDVLFAANRITAEEYGELSTRLILS